MGVPSLWSFAACETQELSVAVPTRRDSCFSPLPAFNLRNREEAHLAQRDFLCCKSTTQIKVRTQKKETIPLQDYNGGQSPRSKYLIRDKYRLHPIFLLLSSLDPDRLLGLLLARPNSCHWRVLFFGLRMPCYIGQITDLQFII